MPFYRKLTNFSDLTEITDSNGFSKDSLADRLVWLTWKYCHIFIQITRFQGNQRNNRFSNQFSRESLIPFSVHWHGKLSIFSSNHQISMKLHISVLLSHFQKRALYRLQFLHRKLSIFIKWTDFKWNQLISRNNKWTDFKGFLAWYQKTYFWWKITYFSNQRPYRFTASLWKITYFHQRASYRLQFKSKKIVRFSVKLQIPRKLKIYQILTNLQKRAFYRLLYLSEILPEWTDFNETMKIKEISDFMQFLWHNALTRTFQMNNFHWFGLWAVGKIHKIAYLLISWKIHTKLGFYCIRYSEKSCK